MGMAHCNSKVIYKHKWLWVKIYVGGFRTPIVYEAVMAKKISEGWAEAWAEQDAN